jgi:hypothetical protein
MTRPDRGWFEPSSTTPLNEPTQSLPTVPQPPKVAARAVIVYRDVPRRPWVLWVFTATLVALTIGVILGQTAAFEPAYRSTADAQTVPTPAPSPSGTPWPDAAHRITVPLAGVKTRTLEVAGATTVLRVRSADLGDTLFDIATTDRGAMPSLTQSERGSRLELIRSSEAGTVGAEIQLNAKVAWTLKLVGGASEQNVDMSAGGLAGLEVIDGAAGAVWQLPEPKGTVRLSVAGPVGQLVVRRKAGTPVRVRLGGGATTAVVDGKSREKVEAGTTLRSTGWSGAPKRYDVVTSGQVASVLTATF